MAEMTAEDMIGAEMIIAMGVLVIEVAVTMTEIVETAESMIAVVLAPQTGIVGAFAEVITGDLEYFISMIMKCYIC
jgi:hypothetical protein